MRGRHAGASQRPPWRTVRDPCEGGPGGTALRSAAGGSAASQALRASGPCCLVRSLRSLTSVPPASLDPALPVERPAIDAAGRRRPKAGGVSGTRCRPEADAATGRRGEGGAEGLPPPPLSTAKPADREGR